MAGFLYLGIYLAAGIFMVRRLLPRKNMPVRIWLGLCLGLMLAMWLPALAAFFLRFSVAAHMAALPVLLGLAALAHRFRAPHTPRPWDTEDTALLKALGYTALPMTALSVYLLYTHNLRPENGALYVGQATYGDLPLHLGIITSLRGAALPAEYSILPGQQLSYPFLCDALSTGLMVLGGSLRLALLVPGALMMALTFSGFMVFALKAAKDRRSAVLAFFLLFINGGLGFLYAADMAGVSLGAGGDHQLQAGVWLDRLRNILDGWYQTPVNHAEFTTYNLRWSNIVADLLVPQRTFLGGWSMLMPCLYLLYDGLMAEKRDIRQFTLLGLMAGGLPLVHTHSYLALVLVSAGWLVWDALKKRDLLPWGVYVAMAGVLSLPQLIFFTFRQAGSSQSFLSFQFNWVNGMGGMKDAYLFFYLKNIGLPFLLLIFSLFEKRHRFLYSGAFVIFIAAELVRFQPNEYDNNKLLYVWYALCSVPVAEYAFRLWDRLRGLGARRLIAGLTLFCFFISGALSLAREVKSNYMMFSQSDVETARWVENNTARDALFITGTQHINPVSALAGRRIVCGPELWLFYHGFSLAGRQKDLYTFYTSSAPDAGIAEKYGAEYILLSPSEKAAYGTEKETFDKLFEKVYENDESAVYRVRKAAP